MKDLASVLDAIDHPGAVFGILAIGLYLLLWKYGGELLKLSRRNSAIIRESHEIAKEARDVAVSAETKVDDIGTAIVTNHGSKNLGDAIDRLTEWMMLHMRESRASDERMAQLRQEVILHLASAGVAEEKIAQALADLDERMNRIEEAGRDQSE